MHLRADRTTARAVAIGAGALGLAITGVAACGSAQDGVATPGAARSSSAAATPSTTAPAVPLTLVSVSPASGSALATPTTPIAFTFSAPLTASSTDEQMSPATAGRWSTSGATLTFTPAVQYAPYTPLTVTVPAGLTGSGRAVLTSAVSARYTTPQPSVLRIQQLLAELHYLPLSFTPTGSSAPLVAAAPATTAPPTSTAPAAAAPGGAATSTSTTAPASGTLTASAISVSDQAGSFAWRWPTIPAGLGQSWAQGASDPITTGAVMAFEADHGLAVDGIAGPSVWAALTAAVAQGKTDPRAYDYISVTETLPETLTVWQDGADVYTSLANTGVPAAPTATGTYPVYERFVSTTMTGINPNGTKYSDPGIPWVAYFHGGDAVHGFVRGSYGFPQSVGCVELPPSHAEVVYPMDYYGTLVTVE